jgi:hypothetical protein
MVQLLRSEIRDDEDGRNFRGRRLATRWSSARERAPLLTPSHTQRLFRQDITDPRDTADITEPTLANEPIENADANDAIDPIDRIDPTLPIDRIDPFEPIDRMEFSDFQDNTLPAVMARFSCSVSWYVRRRPGAGYRG